MVSNLVKQLFLKNIEYTIPGCVFGYESKNSYITL